MSWYHIALEWMSEYDGLQWRKDVNFTEEQVKELIDQIKKGSLIIFSGNKIGNTIEGITIWKTDGEASSNTPSQWDWIKLHGKDVTKEFIISLPSENNQKFSNDEIIITITDEQTEYARKLLYQLENSLRECLKIRIDNNGGRIKESFIKSWKSIKNKESTPPRKPINHDLIYYSTFDELKRIIVQNENWTKIFQKQFGRQDGIISRLAELDMIRDTIAHNRILSDIDFRLFVNLYEEIMRCLPEVK